MFKGLKETIRISLFSLFLFVFSVPVLAQLPQLEDLDPYVEKSMRDWQTPGLAVAIVRNDSMIFAKGYGLRELGKKDNVDEHTLFAVASNSKAFTAALLGMLVDEGKLDWDDRVTEYLSNFQMFDPYVTREINIKDLLTHRSGLPVFGGDHLWIGDGGSREHIVRQLRYLEPNAQFRTVFQYNNLMWLVAGQVFATIAGQTWDDGIKKRIFKPLGMKQSNTSVRYLESIENVATPHEMVAGKLKSIEYDNVDNVAPAGAINSNVIDMAKWMRLNLNGGVYEGQQLLSSEVMREMHSIQIPTKISSFNEEKLGMRFSGYGLGWRISDYKGRKMIRHSGGLSGMISLQTLMPEENLGVMAMTNLAPNSLPWVVTYRILDALFGEPKVDWNEEFLKRRKAREKRLQEVEAELQSKRIKGTKPSLQLEDYTGQYFDKLSGEAEVRLENGGLVFDYNPRHVGDLQHWHYNTFRVIWRHPIFDMSPKSFLQFNLDEMGRVANLRVTFYDPITFTKVYESE